MNTKSTSKFGVVLENDNPPPQPPNVYGLGYEGSSGGGGSF